MSKQLTNFIPLNEKKVSGFQNNSKSLFLSNSKLSITLITKALPYITQHHVFPIFLKTPTTHVHVVQRSPTMPPWLRILVLIAILPNLTSSATDTSTPRSIYDAVMYNGEIDLLLLRLYSLNASVSRFIIVESGCTFSSKPKPHYFRDRDSKNLLVQPFIQKIIPVTVQQHCNTDNDPWSMEKELRNAVLQGLSNDVPGTSLLMIGDVDEIPSTQSLDYIQNQPNICHRGQALHLKMPMFYYDLSIQVSSELWYHPQIMTVHDARDGTWTPQSLRDVGFELSRAASTGTPQHMLLDLGGWHMSYFGNDADRKRKIQSFSHVEFNVPSVLNTLKQSREQSLDPLGRKGQRLTPTTVCHMTSLPLAIVAHPHLFGHFAPHCPTARKACWKHLQNQWHNGIITFSTARDYIKGGEGGGLTNQMVGLKNGLLIAHDTQLPIQLPVAYSRLSWNDKENVWKYKHIPFDVLFASSALLSDPTINSHICVLTEIEVESFVLLDGRKYSSNRINVLESIHQAGWRYLNVSYLGNVIHTVSENNLVSNNVIKNLWLGATSDLIWMDSKTTRKNKTSGVNTRFTQGKSIVQQLATHILRSIRFSSRIEKIALNIVSILHGLNLSYVGFHVRLNEHDSTAFAGGVGGQKTHVLPPQVIQNVQQYIDGQHIAAPPLMYVASGNRDASLLHALPWLATRKEILAPTSIEQIMDVPEMLGAVDFMVCEHADYFVGFSQSTFSALVKLRRRYNGQSAIFYNTKEPPWQIVLSLDPTEQIFTMPTRDNNECDDRRLHPGERADCLFTNK